MKKKFVYVARPEGIERRARQAEHLRAWYEAKEAEATNRILGEEAGTQSRQRKKARTIKRKLFEGHRT